MDGSLKLLCPLTCLVYKTVKSECKYLEVSLELSNRKWGTAVLIAGTHFMLVQEDGSAMT